MKYYYLVLFVLITFLSCNSKDNDTKNIKYGGIDRTLHLLNTSNAVNRNVVDILFYGQSIVGGLKSEILIDSIRKRFPYASIKHKNKAIGGFTLPSLLKTSEHDLYIKNPDLIIFHGYDGIKDGLFDSLIGNIRSRLNSDILLFNHHYVWDKPESKLNLLNQSHDFDSREIKKIAEKHNCALVDVRAEWKAYLKSNNISPSELMGNTIDPNVHPNDKGNILLRSILLSAFKKNSTVDYNVENDELRKEVFIGKNVKDFNIDFSGNRLNLHTDRRFNKDAEIAILIDEKKPSEIRTNYSITLPSRGLKSWMPAIKKVSLGKPFPKKESWTVTLFEIDRANKTFKFALNGGLTGFDGQGHSESNFISNSGRIHIDKEDFNIFEIEKISNNPMPEGFQIKFKVNQLVKDTLNLRRKTPSYLLFRSFAKGNHTLKLNVIKGDPVLKKITISSPHNN